MSGFVEHVRSLPTNIRGVTLLLTLLYGSVPWARASVRLCNPAGFRSPLAENTGVPFRSAMPLMVAPDAAAASRPVNSGTGAVCATDPTPPRDARALSVGDARRSPVCHPNRPGSKLQLPERSFPSRVSSTQLQSLLDCYGVQFSSWLVYCLPTVFR